MSVEFRAYDNEHGDPVVVLVATGTYDVSRFVGLHASGRCEDQDRAARIREAIRRHRGGRAALKLLRDHGGPDFTDTRRSQADCLAAADALEGAVHEVDDDDSANVLARLADQWRAEAANLAIGAAPAANDGSHAHG